MKLKSSIAMAAILAAVSSTAIAQDECDGSESPDGWSVWCREAPLEPTAAGYTPLGESPVKGTDITDIFEPDTEGETGPYYRAAYDFDERTVHEKKLKWYGWKTIGRYDNGSTADAAGIGTTLLELEEGCCQYLPDPGDRIAGVHTNMGGSPIATFEFGEFLGAFVNKDPLFFDSGYFVGGDFDGSYEIMTGKEPIPSTIQDYWRGKHTIKTYYAYVEGEPYEECCGTYRDDTSQKVGTEHRFVGGPLTPLADIQQLQTNQVIAGYEGRSDFHNQNVGIEVNFTTGKFGGSWTGGNAYHNVVPVSFEASGNLVGGQHIVANSINSLQPGVAVTGGTLRGSFYGGGAAAVAGAYEVQVAPTVVPNGQSFSADVRPIEPYGFNDVFSAKQTYQEVPEIPNGIAD
jgi:hypothetical protein